MALYNLASYTASPDRIEQTRSALQKAAGHAQAAYRINPRHAGNAKILKRSLHSLARVCCSMKDYPAALQVAERITLVQSAGSVDYVRAAYVCSTCIVLIREDKKLKAVGSVFGRQIAILHEQSARAAARRTHRPLRRHCCEDA